MRTNEEIAIAYSESPYCIRGQSIMLRLLFRDALNEATEPRDKEIKALKVEIGKLESELQWIKLDKVLEKY